MKKDKTQIYFTAYEVFLVSVGVFAVLLSGDWGLMVDCALGCAIVELMKAHDAEVDAIGRLQKIFSIQAREICSLQSEVEALKEKKTAKKSAKRQTKSTKTKQK